jgi:hypothetical protein
VNWTHLFIGVVVASWVLSVEYRLWANLRILSEQLKVGQKRSDLHAVGK